MMFIDSYCLLMPRTETVDHNGAAIRALRVERDLTLAQLAAKVGRTSQTLSNIEHHNRRCSKALLDAIAAALDVAPERLLKAAPAAPSTLLSVPAAAAELDCSERHVYRLIAEGELRTVDIAQDRTRTKTRVRRDDLMAFVESRTAVPA